MEEDCLNYGKKNISENKKRISEYQQFLKDDVAF